VNRTQDRVLLAAAVLVAVVVVGGLVVVQANTGPYAHEAEPADHRAQMSGSYVVQTGPEACPDRGPSCPARTTVDLTIDGLPALDGQTRYGLFLADGDRLTPLGALETERGVPQLTTVARGDGDARERLVLGLVEASRPNALVLALGDVELPASGGDAVDLEATLRPGLDAVGGTVELDSVGAVESAVTVSATIDELPSAGAWGYHAWLVDEDAERWSSLGGLEGYQRASTLEVDARLGGQALADQDRFVVTIEPPAAGAAAEPEGLAVVDLPVQADGLLS
jgi:hypothetical protein